jgi:hypothetical protein
MNRISISAATMAVAISLALIPSAAFAEDAPVEEIITTEETPAPEVPVEEVPEVVTPTEELAPWIYAEYPDTGDTSTWVLDCEKAEWFAPVTHYYAEQTAPGEYAEPTITVTVESMGAATGNDVDADCPNWQINEDGDWFDATPIVPVEEPTDTDPVVVTASVTDEVELRFFQVIRGRVLGGR